MTTCFPIAGLLGTDDEGFALVHVSGYDIPAEEPKGISPAKALEAIRAEGDVYSATEMARIRAEEEENGGFVSRAPYRMFADFTGADRREFVKVSQAEDVRRNSPMDAEDANPKTLMGAKKPDLSVVPASALLHVATAMMNGAVKYGPYNYRDKPVPARTYVAAAMRHLLSYLDGEDFSQDTVEAGAPVHHLAHVMACCAILLDTTECNTLIDDRPTVKGQAGNMVERFNQTGTLAA